MMGHLEGQMMAQNYTHKKNQELVKVVILTSVLSIVIAVFENIINLFKQLIKDIKYKYHYYQMDGQHQKKQFNYPKREDIIQEIKSLDDSIENVSLNLIKCHFDATQKDIEKSFPQYKFIKVKNYNPGSFEVVFEMKIDAINFVKTCYDRKILNRRFFIKMGRQHKEIVENWTCIGQTPNRFNHHKKGEFHNKGQYNKKGQHNKQHKDEKEHKQRRQNRQHKEHKQPRQPREAREPRQQKEHRQPRQQKAAQKPVQVQTTQEKKKPEQKKAEKVLIPQPQNVTKVEGKQQVKEPIEPKKPKEEKKAEKPKQEEKKVEEKKQKPTTPQVTQDHKKQTKPAETKPIQTRPVQTKPVQTKPVQTKKQTPKVVEQTTPQDDGWIKVPTTKGKKR